jgi:Na+-transporting NADH:ubiquinone oxidoreductase subunit C
VLLDKQKKVLAVSGLIEEGASPSVAEVQRLFEERITTVIVDMEAGEIVPADEAGIDPKAYDQRKAAKSPATSFAVDQNLARVARVPQYTLVYEVWADDAQSDLELQVLPVEGMGLWGTMYGFVAIDDDNETIRGLTFYEHKETPGLGGEVDNPSWKAKWPGRKAYGPEGEPRIKVIKGPAGPPEEAPYSVDGLSGATITSNGVTNLLRFWLGDNGFGPFLQGGAEERSAD